MAKDITTISKADGGKTKQSLATYKDQTSPVQRGLGGTQEGGGYV